ncbi:peptide/nickel transport system permease protein [Aurantimonas endophytica]|uniref:Peptide/nickel transport system permease protein n=1 Tax=Aurantimonas endophytica TaxID=1522175 RepID=A0A7W6MPT8_9HYPH|nr:peptide/nickel transport system permease protein [Aurantimonas endophytica]
MWIALLILIAVTAPWLGTSDPLAINPAIRNVAPATWVTIAGVDGSPVSRLALLGTDTLGRDLFSRVLYGARVSLAVGFSVAALACAGGLAIGLLTGCARWADALIMRMMDGIMAIPGVLLAIAFVAAWRPGLVTVIVAILIPEIPRVVRLVRSVVLKVQGEPYVEAAIASGTRPLKIMTRHVMPSTVAPLITQGTFACVSAVLLEATLSFLGIGVPSDIPSWGNIMADGRQWFRLQPHVILFPGLLITATVLAISNLGDALRHASSQNLRRRG